MRGAARRTSALCRYQAYFIASLGAAAGVDDSAAVGVSSRRPYYTAKPVCQGASCKALTPADWASIQGKLSSARGILACVDTATLQATPSALPLPFGLDGALKRSSRADGRR